MMFRVFILVFILMPGISSCRKDKNIEPVLKRYLHLSHTRRDSNPLMDSLTETIDYTVYDMLWLGGDLAYLTSDDQETIKHVDSIFDLGNFNTLWALGNHDYSDLNTINNITQRPPYYAYYANGLTFLVLDTQDSVSQIIDEQLALVNSVLDTISYSSHLIVLHHQLIWLSGNPELEGDANDISNGPLGECSYCIHENNFYKDIYPGLVMAEENGIEVICIAGDIGSKTKSFSHLTEDGIQFLASGIKADQSGNLGLLFEHDETNRKLRWFFLPVAEL